MLSEYICMVIAHWNSTKVRTVREKHESICLAYTKPYFHFFFWFLGQFFVPLWSTEKNPPRHNKSTMVSNMRMNNMHFMMPTLKQSTKKKAGFPLSLRVPYCLQWTQYFFVLRQRSQHFHHSFWSWLKNVSAWRESVFTPDTPGLTQFRYFD